MLHLDSQFSLDLRAHCTAIFVSPMLNIGHIVGLCGFHFSVQVEIENVVFETDWNEFVLSMPVHPFLKMSSHSLTNFAVNRDHVTTVMSQVEILSSFARDLRSAAPHFVYTSESSIQRSEQSVFVVSIWNPFTTGSPIESFHLLLHLDQSSMGMCSLQLLCPSSSSPRSNRFGLLVAPRSKPPSENKLAEVS